MKIGKKEVRLRDNPLAIVFSILLVFILGLAFVAVNGKNNQQIIDGFDHVSDKQAVDAVWLLERFEKRRVLAYDQCMKRAEGGVKQGIVTEDVAKGQCKAIIERIIPERDWVTVAKDNHTWIIRGLRPLVN